jgi:hypothetical protein
MAVHPFRQLRFAGCLAAILLVLAASGLRAELLSSDSFDYLPLTSDLAGKSGGSGWNGAWIPGGFNASISANYDIAAGSLTYPQLNTVGNRAVTAPQNAIAGLRRPFALPVGANDTATRYLSALLQPQAPLGAGALAGFFGIYLDATNATGDRDLFVGKPGGGALDRWVIEQRGGAGQFASAIPVTVDQTALLVLKAELRPGNDRFTLYVNPDLSLGEPATGTVKFDMDIGTVDGIVLYSTGSHAVDEIRWGTSFADVTPIPEPATALLMLLGVGVLAAMWRRQESHGMRR